MIATRALPGLRLSLRFARFELAFIGGLIVLITAATFLVARELHALAPPAICFEPYEAATGRLRGCEPGLLRGTRTASRVLCWRCSSASRCWRAGSSG